MLNPLYTYILNIEDLVWLGFYGISTIVGYLMLNPLYTYILNIEDLVWLGFYGISTIVGYLMANLLYTYILNVEDLVWLGFYGISTIVGYLMLNLFIHINPKYIMCKQISSKKFLNNLELLLLEIIQWFQTIWLLPGEKVESICFPHTADY